MKIRNYEFKARVDDLREYENRLLTHYRHAPDAALKEILVRQFGISVIVSKIRRIYFIGNIKFHLDTVSGLGTFIEIEVIDDCDEFTTDQLRYQCNHYLHFLGLKKEQMADRSYSDLLESSEQKKLLKRQTTLRYE